MTFGAAMRPSGGYLVMSKDVEVNRATFETMEQRDSAGNQHILK